MSFSFSASLPKGAFTTVPSRLPDLIAATRAGSSPTCRMETSFVGPTPSRLSSARKPKSADEPKRLTPNFLPFR